MSGTDSTPEPDATTIKRLHWNGATFSEAPQLRPTRFIKGPIPLNWISAAGKLPGKSLHTGLALWYLSGLHKAHRVTLTNCLAARFGVQRDAKHRALRFLEQAHLVAVRRQNGRSTEVTILTGTTTNPPANNVGDNES